MEKRPSDLFLNIYYFFIIAGYMKSLNVKRLSMMEKFFLNKKKLAENENIPQRY